MRTLEDAVREGVELTLEERVDLAKKVTEFQGTEIYKLLTSININDIKRRLAMGVEGVSAEYKNGLLEGILLGLEKRVRSIIAEANIAVKNDELEKEIIESEKEDTKRDEEDINPNREQSV